MKYLIFLPAFLFSSAIHAQTPNGSKRSKFDLSITVKDVSSRGARSTLADTTDYYYSVAIRQLAGTQDRGYGVQPLYRDSILGKHTGKDKVDLHYDIQFPCTSVPEIYIVGIAENYLDSMWEGDQHFPVGRFVPLIELVADSADLVLTGSFEGLYLSKPSKTQAELFAYEMKKDTFNAMLQTIQSIMNEMEMMGDTGMSNGAGRSVLLYRDSINQILTGIITRNRNSELAAYMLYNSGFMDKGMNEEFETKYSPWKLTRKEWLKMYSLLGPAALGTEYGKLCTATKPD